MSRWFWLFIAVAIALLPASARPQSAPQRLIAIGDLHGDHDAWRAIAQAAGLMDTKGKWSGGNATLVQLGDIVDRGPDSLKIIRDLQELQREAPKQGGKVYVLLGNHESMMMIGDLRYVHPGEYAAFVTRDSKGRRDRVFEVNRAAIEAGYRARTPGMSAAAIKDSWLKEWPLGKIEYQLAWRPDGELGRWALANPAVLKLGDTLFVHGGISATYANVPINEINRQVAAALTAQEQAPTAIISHPQGPLWYRGLIVRNDGDEATKPPVPPGTTIPLTINQEIDLALKGFGVKRLVVAHTPSRQGIISDDGGKLWRIDSAISRHYNGKLAYLEIVGDQVAAHDVPRPAGKEWGAK